MAGSGKRRTRRGGGRTGLRRDTARSRFCEEGALCSKGTSRTLWRTRTSRLGDGDSGWRLRGCSGGRTEWGTRTRSPTRVSPTRLGRSEHICHSRDTAGERARPRSEAQGGALLAPTPEKGALLAPTPRGETLRSPILEGGSRPASRAARESSSRRPKGLSWPQAPGLCGCALPGASSRRGPGGRRLSPSTPGGRPFRAEAAWRAEPPNAWRLAGRIAGRGLGPKGLRSSVARGFTFGGAARRPEAATGAAPQGGGPQKGARERGGDAERRVEKGPGEQENEQDRPEVLFRERGDPPRGRQSQQDVEARHARHSPAVGPLARTPQGVAVAAEPPRHAY